MVPDYGNAQLDHSSATAETTRRELLNNKIAPTDDEVYTAKAVVAAAANVGDGSSQRQEHDREVIKAMFLSPKPSLLATAAAAPAAGGTSAERPKEFRALKRRWYILLLYAMYTVAQVSVWNTFGPISDTARKVFGWEQDTIALLNDLGPIAYILSGVGFSWVLNAKGSFQSERSPHGLR